MSIERKQSHTANQLGQDQPALHTVKSSDSYLPQQQKISYMQIRRQVFLSSAGVDSQLRMVLFALFFKSMCTSYTANRNAFDVLCELFVRGGSNGWTTTPATSTADSLTSRLYELLQQHYGEQEPLLERTLVSMFNDYHQYDELLVSNAKKLMTEQGQPAKAQNLLACIHKYCQEVELSILPMSESMRELSRTNLYLYQQRLIKLSVRVDTSDSQSEGSSAFSIPKVQQQPTDTMELTLNKSPASQIDNQMVNVTEWKTHPPRKTSFWDMFCCSE